MATNLPYGRPGTPSWNYAMRQATESTGTFDQRNTNANNLFSQAQGQLNQANNLIGGMGTSIAEQSYDRASGLYAQANTFLGYANTSNELGYDVVNSMIPKATTAPQQSIVSNLTETYTTIKNGIGAAYNNAGTLFTQLQQKISSSQSNLPESVTTNATNVVLGSSAAGVNQISALPDDAAGSIVKEQQRANAESADVQNPDAADLVYDNGEIATVSEASNSTNAIRPQLEDNANLDTGVVSTPSGEAVSPETIQGGVCAAPDDWISQFTTSIGTSTGIGSGGRPVIPPGFTAPIIAQPNKLAKLSSQTYSVSIYITSEVENKAILNGQKVIFPQNSLLIQSGGINSSTVQNQRNQYFNVDFYIDDVEITSLVGTQGVGSAHNVTKMKFRISEPMGITFLNRLDRAVREYSKIGEAPVTGIMQNYCMIIRFYGYDQDGNLVTGEQLGISSAAFGTDSNAISEKWIPFTIGDIQYQIATKGVEYDVTAVVTQSNTMFSSSFGGGIPFNFELVAPDLKTLFNGPVAYSTDDTATTQSTTGSTGTAGFSDAGAAAVNTSPTAPPKASAISTNQTVTQGLATALNQWQQDLVKKGTQEIADQYEIQLYNMAGLIDATMVKQGTQDKTKSPMTQSTDASQNLLGSKNNYDKNSKNYNITAGTQIAQLIDLAVRNSSFITSQQTIAFDQNTQQPLQQQPVATTMWFRIQGSALPIGYDRKRRNTAYKFKYLVTPYQINDPRSPYFSTARYRGVHKVYNYWFTGQNTEVLDFQIDVNANYAQVVGVDTAVSPSFSGRWAEKRVFQTRPGESSQGGDGTSTMPAATLAERLYSIEDVMKCELTILGDPDWIIQSEIFYMNPTFDSFMPDGSVNAAGSEVLYEVRFNTPTDFELSTGLTPTYQNNTMFSTATNDFNIASESIVYSANEVHTSLKGGKFTQKIKGTIKNFDQQGANTTTKTTATKATNNPTTPSRTATIEPTGMEGFSDAGMKALGYDTTNYNTTTNQINNVTNPSVQQQVINYANRNAAGVVTTGSTATTGTGTPVAQTSTQIQVDSNKISLPYGRPGTPSWNYAMRLQGAAAAPTDDAGYAP